KASAGEAPKPRTPTSAPCEKCSYRASRIGSERGCGQRRRSRARNPRASRPKSGGLDLDALRLILCLLGLRQVYRQHAFTVRRGDLVGVDVGRQLDAAPEVPVRALAPVHVLLLAFLLLLFLALDRQRVIPERDLD